MVSLAIEASPWGGLSLAGTAVNVVMDNPGMVPPDDHPSADSISKWKFYYDGD